MNSWTKQPAGGYNRGLYEALGAVFNEGTGFYEMLGLTNLTEKDMANIQLNAGLRSVVANSGANISKEVPRIYLCNLPSVSFADNNMSNYTPIRFIYFISGNTAEIIKLCEESRKVVVSSDSANFFYACSKLKKIIGVMDFGSKFDTSLCFNGYHGCPKLEDLRIINLNNNLNFDKCVSINDASVLYMITNAKPKSPITIKLSSVVYDRVMNNKEITTALAAQPNVSLASI